MKGMNVKLRNHFVANVQFVIHDHGLSQQQIADLAGISRVNLNRILQLHAVPSIDTCEAIAAAIELPLATLLLPPRQFEKVIKEIFQTMA